MLGRLILIRTKKLYSVIILMLIMLWGCGADSNLVGELFTPSILSKFSSVCGGGANTNSAPYNGTGKTHLIVLLNSSGDVHKWSDDLPADWWPNSEQDVELVACLDKERVSRIQRCSYSGGSDIERFRLTVDVTLREAQTGNIVASMSFYGSSPRQCKLVEDESTTRLVGGHVQVSDVMNWLESFVKS